MQRLYRATSPGGEGQGVRVVVSLSIMSLTLLFIRHGESAVNLSGTISNRLLDFNPLSELGRAQARSLLASLQGRRILSVWSSPLERARETAEILAAGFGLEPQIADGLREPDCGIAEGRSDPEAWDLHAGLEAAWKAGALDHRIPGGESFLDVRDRFVPFIERPGREAKRRGGDHPAGEPRQRAGQHAPARAR